MEKQKRYEERLQELDRIEKEIELRKRVEDRERELGLRRTFKKPAWAKIMMTIMIIICLEIIIYSEIAMWSRYDLSALYALVGVAASLAAAIWAYCEKSKAENTKGGIVYEKAMQEVPGNPDVTPDPETITPGSDQAAG